LWSIRGKQVRRPLFGKTHGEAKSMKRAGVKELLVASQHTGTYEADR